MQPFSYLLLRCDPFSVKSHQPRQLVQDKLTILALALRGGEGGEGGEGRGGEGKGGGGGGWGREEEWVGEGEGKGGWGMGWRTVGQEK